MVCRLNLTEREPPKQLNPINMIPPHPTHFFFFLRQIIKHIGAKVRPSYYQHKGGREAMSNFISVIGELDFLQGRPMLVVMMHA